MKAFLKSFLPALLAIFSFSLAPLPTYADDTYSGKDCSKYVDAYGDPIQDTYNLCMSNGGYDGTKGQKDCSGLSSTTAIEQCLEENKQILSGNTSGNSNASSGLIGTITIDSGCRNFLGMVSWDCNITAQPSNEDELTNNIITIAANVFTDITVIASYLVLGFVIYGGYLYMFSSGDPGKAMNGKKTLTNAFIGLAIVLLASVILNTIRIVLIGNAGKFSDCGTTACATGTELVTNLIQWVIGIAGVVSGAFVVIGGVSYMTSAGEPSKLQKAKQTITYALIGLAIVGLAEIITAFVTNIINNA